MQTYGYLVEIQAEISTLGQYFLIKMIMQGKHQSKKPKNQAIWKKLIFFDKNPLLDFKMAEVIRGHVGLMILAKN